jgi:hypothetical protein
MKTRKCTLASIIQRHNQCPLVSRSRSFGVVPENLSNLCYGRRGHFSVNHARRGRKRVELGVRLLHSHHSRQSSAFGLKGSRCLCKRRFYVRVGISTVPGMVQLSNVDPALIFSQLASTLVDQYGNQVDNRMASNMVIIEGINGRNGYVDEFLGLGTYLKALKLDTSATWRPCWTKTTLMPSCGH